MSTEKRIVTGEQAKARIEAQLQTFPLSPELRQNILTFILESTHDAWMRGKSFGWYKANEWHKEKRQGAPVAA